MDEAIFIPITFFVMVVLLVWLFQHFALKKRVEAFQTLRFAIEKGQPLTPETLESMARMASPANASNCCTRPSKADGARGALPNHLSNQPMLLPR